MNYFSIVLQQIGIFMVYAIIGVVAVKTHILDRSGLNMMSRFITRVLLPLLVFTNTVNGTSRAQFLSAAFVILISALLYLLLYLLAAVLARVMRLEGNRKNIYRACTMFGNCGFIGIPIITALFPQNGGIYIAMYTVIDQLVLWTVGINLTSPAEGKTTISAKERMRKMLNPAAVAVLLGVFFVLTEIRLPGILSTALSKTGAAASPLAMIYLGGVFCYIHIAEYFKRIEIFVMAAAKMLLLPCLVYAALSHVPAVSAEIAATISILCGMPAMSSVAMMAESQGSDSDYAAGMVFATTVFSIVTLPLICLVL